MREKIAQNPRLGVALAAGLVIVGLTVIALQLPGRSAPTGHAQVFFTVDDGKTWFADSASKIPPFDKDGQPAVRAYVYRCPDGTKFVNYLERFRPDAKRAVEEASKLDPNAKGPPNIGAAQAAYIGGREVKRPGDAKWIGTGNFREAAKITAVKCPDGSNQAVAVEP